MANQNNMQNMQSMMSRLRGNAQQAMSYEEKHMQIEALKVIPLVDLYERAFKSENPKTSFSDELLCQLLAWFKFRFFSWTNQPQCMQCQDSVPESCKFSAQICCQFQDSGPEYWNLLVRAVNSHDSGPES